MQRPWGRKELGASGKGDCQYGWNFETWNQGERMRHWQSNKQFLSQLPGAAARPLPLTPIPFPTSLRGTSCHFSTKITILIFIPDNPTSTPTPEGALRPFPREGDSRGGSYRQHFLSFFVALGSSHQGLAGTIGSCEIGAERALKSARAHPQAHREGMFCGLKPPRENLTGLKKFPPQKAKGKHICLQDTALFFQETMWLFSQFCAGKQWMDDSTCCDSHFLPGALNNRRNFQTQLTGAWNSFAGASFLWLVSLVFVEMQIPAEQSGIQQK